jgi:hypothetical protein
VFLVGEKKGGIEGASKQLIPFGKTAQARQRAALPAVASDRGKRASGTGAA